MRETGMAVSVNMTVIRTSQISSVFRCKSSSARYFTIRCLLQSNGIVIRSKTHEVQTAPAEKREEAKAWVATVVTILTQPICHQDWIANMDQTPVPFTMTPKTTLNEQGPRTVNVCSSTGSTMQLTLAVFVTASGKKLTPYIIFKGKLNRYIMREFSKVNSRYPENAHFTVQDNAWMDEQCCLEGVEKCVKPGQKVLWKELSHCCSWTATSVMNKLLWSTPLLNWELRFSSFLDNVQGCVRQWMLV